MAKKTNKIVQEQLEQTQPQLFPKADKETMLKLFKVAAFSQGQVEQVIGFYRKYVNPNQPFTNSSCGNCQSSFTKIFSNLREWLGKNMDKFEA